MLLPCEQNTVPIENMRQMTAYQIMCKSNEAIIMGHPIENEALKELSDSLIGSAKFSGPDPVSRQGTEGFDNRLNMYPIFYMPPHNNGKKYRLITGQMPKTHILSANHYELEILRLLTLWKGQDELINKMVSKTLERLEATCFGNFCEKGECIGAGVSALRLLTAVRPQDTRWIERLLSPMASIFADPQAHEAAYKNLPIFYFCLALAGADSDLAVQAIRKRKDYLFDMLRKGWLTGPATNDTYNLLLKYVLRLTLSRLPEYSSVIDAHIYVSPKEGRCYCDT